MFFSENNNQLAIATEQLNKFATTYLVRIVDNNCASLVCLATSIADLKSLNELNQLWVVGMRDNHKQLLLLLLLLLLVLLAIHTQLLCNTLPFPWDPVSLECILPLHQGLDVPSTPVANKQTATTQQQWHC